MWQDTAANSTLFYTAICTNYTAGGFCNKFLIPNNGTRDVSVLS